MSESASSTEHPADTSGRSLQDWLDEYSRYHVNPVNKKIHWVCVPIIMMTLLGMLWSLPVPEFIGPRSMAVSWASVLIVVSLLFYLRLSITLTIGMALITAAMLAVFPLVESVRPGLVWQSSLVVFVLAWIGQFIGHRIEGRKPAFFQDLQFLLVGPIWILADIFRRLKIPV